MTSKTTVVSTRIPTDVADAAFELARRRRKTVADLLKEGLTQLLRKDGGDRRKMAERAGIEPTTL